MKKMILAAFAAVAVLSGCTSIETSSRFSALSVGDGDARPVKHIYGKMTGCYLFGFIPLLTGSAAEVDKSAIFRNTLKIDNMVLFLTAEARSGAQAVRVQDLQTSTGSFFLFPLIQFRWVEGSCNSVGQLKGEL